VNIGGGRIRKIPRRGNSREWKVSAGDKYHA
jgi:hypothetical protein